MNVTVNDLMVGDVQVAKADETLADLRSRMLAYGINALPIVDEVQGPLGIVTSTDLVADYPEDAKASEVMTSKVYTVPRYSDVHIAARVMRNHRLHHVIVTHEKAVVGVLSSFDLLKLVEEHRFVMKNPPTESTRKGAKRR